MGVALSLLGARTSERAPPPRGSPLRPLCPISTKSEIWYPLAGSDSDSDRDIRCVSVG